MAAHGLIHLLGFAKALSPERLSPLTHNIAVPIGLLWLATAILFIFTAFLLTQSKNYWWMVGLLTISISQVLLIMSWTDAKFGTIPNLIVLFVIVLAMGSYFFEKSYERDVVDNLRNNNSLSSELVTTDDIDILPETVQKYIEYTGSVGKPKVKNMNIVFEGKMRAKGKGYFSFRSEQYNFFTEPSRLFFMKAKIFGLLVPGYHRYIDTKASMDIRLFGLISVSKHSDGAMNKVETVTLFNDMCLMAPATLIDKRIVWQDINEDSAKATFTNKNISITATLYFNDKHQLVNFVSDDRVEINENKQYRFSTPVSSYKNFGGYNLPSYGETTWHYPEGDFTYGKFNLKEINYNVVKRIDK